MTGAVMIRRWMPLYLVITSIGLGLLGQPIVSAEDAFESEPAAPVADITITLEDAPADLLVDKVPRQQGAPLQIGFARALPEGSESILSPGADHWRQNSRGDWQTTVSIHSAGASALRVGLRVDTLPGGARIRYVDGKGATVPAAGRVEQSVQPVWSPVAHGERLSLTITLASGVMPRDTRLSIVQISHFAVSPYNADAMLDVKKQAAACNLDAVCYEEYDGVRSAVSRVIWTVDGGSFTCTGTLLNDSDSDDEQLYYLTANHCLNDPAAVETVETYWYFESNACDSATRSSRFTRVTGGADLLSTDEGTDTTLMLLRDRPAVPVTFAGWSTEFNLGSVAGIHHPQGDWKKISFGDALRFSTRDENLDLAASDPAANFIKVRWREGVTEQGSSGSAIFNANNQIVGTLFGGVSSCITPNGIDTYGRFDRAYERSGWPHYLASDASQKPVTVSRRGLGRGSVLSQPAGIDCSDDCAATVASFAKGATVTLTAAAVGSDRFLAWGAGDCDSQPTPQSCVVTAARARYVRAEFAADSTALAAAINDDSSAPDLELSQTGDAAWQVTLDSSYRGGSAARSGDISDDQTSELSTEIMGPGSVSFWWRVSSEKDYDFLELRLDGELQTAISGNTDWQQVDGLTIPAGQHTVSWTYRKDISESAGLDRGWIDHVVVVSGNGDRDQDGVPDSSDAFPDDPGETVDADNDGLGANREAALGTSDNDADSDNDGVSDFDEVNAGTDPLDGGASPVTGLLRLLLEEPVNGQTVSGVGNLRGWAVSSASIERISIFIDGNYVFDAPYGGQRPDVAAVFPEVSSAGNAGFSLAFNYSDLSPGEHRVRAVAETADGGRASSEVSMTVVRFAESFIPDPAQVDISGAQCRISGKGVDLLNTLIGGVRNDLSLRWRTASQGFELIRIEQ